MEQTKKIYNSFKNLGLPPFDKLNYEFDIGVIDEQDLFLRNIRHRMMEKVNKYIELLEELVQPENFFVSLWEYKEVDEQSKSKSLELLREMMYINRQSWKMNLEDSDKDNAKFIKDTYTKWVKTKKDIIKIVDKLKDSWKKQITMKDKLEYMG
jgi:TRAP-type C4-dicarboxylate transport system substrate-binding protein